VHTFAHRARLMLGVPLSEAALLNICLSHRDGTLVREGGLILRRTRKPQYRKNMEVFLGEAPPAPMSPTSPNYLATPRPTFGKRGNNDSLTPTKATNKQKRASTVSVMSGLGVPVPAQAIAEAPPSPTTTARSPASGSFLTKSKKMYNFFGHRPPSELISNHLAEYFPSAKKRELEKTVRHSMLRMSMGPGSRVGSIGSGERLSIDSPHGSDRRQSLEKRQSPEKKSPEKRQSVERKQGLEKSPQSRRSMSLSTSKSFTASPPADTILEEENEVEGLPRSNLSIETGKESETPSAGTSIKSQPPLLPPFEPATESLSESLQAFSPTEGKNQSDLQGLAPVPSPRSKQSDSSISTVSRPRPKSIMLARRGSAGSSRSRLSMLSQLRKNRDKSDTASIITVDMITADVENRRASRITFAESDDEEEELADIHVPAAIEDPIAPTSEADEEEGDEDGEDEASEEEEEEDSSEDESTDEDEEVEIVVDEDADHGKAYMSTGCKFSAGRFEGAKADR
jgi:mitogen-activated protein kinase kinase kinase